MPNSNVAVALLYETQALGRHLRDALTSLGTPIVYEAAPANLDLVALENSGARVVVVNLDPDVDAHLDDVYGLLEDDRYSVVFNDAAASSALSGWDQARWARHLAAKILGDADIDPPRPEGAEAVPGPAPQPVAIDEDDAANDEIELASEPEAGYDARLASIAASAADDTAPVAVADNPLDLLESSYEAMHQSATAAFPSPPPPPAEAFDFSTLEALTATPAPPDAAPEQALETELLDFDDATPPAAEPAPTISWDLVEADVGFGAATSDETPRKDAIDDTGPFDLDALETLFGEAPSAPPVDGASVDVGDLGEIDFESVLPESEIEAPATRETETLSLADDFALDLASPPPAPPEAPPPKIAAALDWSLEEMLEGDGPTVPASQAPAASGPADFGIEKLSAAEYLAPATEDAAPPVPDLDFSLELMPLEEAVAPQPVEREAHETWLDPDQVKLPPKIRRIFVLGASIGGPEAVREFLGWLPRDYPALFLLAQHMGAEFMELMAQQLAKSTPLTVRTPTHGERVAHGEVVIVPTTHRLQIDADGVVLLERASTDGAYSPSIDRVLMDVADRYGASASAIVFSGMTTDAVEGCKYLAGKGGSIYAQHPDSAVVSSMIDGAVEAGVVKFLGTPSELAEQILAESKSKR